MNLKQFADLKVGDVVINSLMPTRSRGEITEVGARHVTVRWDGAPMTFNIARQSTTWMHWELENGEDVPQSNEQD
jgi:hypothetical protein